jgi:hypothetical protein
MLFSEWIEVTRRVLSHEGDDRLLPTVADPRNGRVRTLKGIPSEIPDTTALQEWIVQLGLTEFFFAVSENPQRIVLGHIKRQAASYAALEKTGASWNSVNCEQPTWWRAS